MDTLLTTFRGVFGAAWRLHFSIPEAAYWAAIVLAGFGFTTASTNEAIGWTALLLLGIQGVVRWHYHRGRGRRALVLARFAAPQQAEGRALEAQQLFLTRLRDELSPDDARRVHAVPAVVGTSDVPGALRLRRRLRAWLLVYGRVTESSDGWSLFARVLTPIGGGHHLDDHTRDATPIKRSWRDRVDLLSPTERVLAEEYPLTAAAEVESIIRGSAGQVALALGKPDRAQRLLQEALDSVPSSESAAVDGLRIALADALTQQGDVDVAVGVLRERAAQQSAAPDLLRKLHWVLSQSVAAGIENADDAYKEGVVALRRAAADQADPQRDMTLFNLSSLLGASGDLADRQEAMDTLRELLRSSKRYSRAWYVHRLLGADAWREATDARQTGDAVLATERYQEAGRRYAKAIRLRPRVGFLTWQGTCRPLWTVYPPAAIIRANLADVHDALGRRFRSRWQWWRCERKRDKLLRRGLSRFAAGEWQLAYANFDWVIVGRGDFRDTVALVYRSVATYQYGNDAEALAGWQQAHAWQQFALVTRAAMLRDPHNHPLVRGVPGDEPTDLDDVTNLLGMPKQPPGPLPVGYTGWRARLLAPHEPTGGL